MTWSVVVYGPNGITSEGVTLTPTGTYGENLRIDIAAAVVGEVVVSVQFPSTSGMTVIGEPGVVASRPPGALTGIEVRPGTVAMPAGPTVPLEVWGVYDGTSKALLFTYTGNTTFTSENEALATVDTDGQVTLVAPGATTVQATYNGSLTGSSSIQVWAPAPEVTSPAVASATLGQAFNYQITANGSPVAFSADGLPDELTVNPSTGLVSGTPAFEGLFHFTVGAANSDGQKGIQEVTLTVTGTNQAPTAIGLDTASVPAMQPSGTMVGRLATADANPLDTFTYQLVSGAGDTDNGLFSLSGDILLTSVLIDPAVKPQCAIRLRSTDTGGQPVEQALVLPVLGGPDITGPPVDTIVFSGWAFVLGVEATGREPLAYQWQEGGVDIPGATARTLDLVAGMPGTRSFTVRVSNEFDAVTSVPAMVTVAPLSFGAWTARYAVPGQESILPEGDLNGDGIVNLFDYAFGTEPDQTAAAMPRLRMTGNGPSYVFRRAANIESAIIDILTSTDLDKWNLYVPPPGDLSITPLDNWAEEIEVRLPQQDRMFLKLEVNP
ncbi:MAG: putative Ig domain-containing protein [Verrucomicrobia bacterium]|nr:putative Ig domain-containing protein [Verrucomicrobiota bacterium]